MLFLLLLPLSPTAVAGPAPGPEPTVASAGRPRLRRHGPLKKQPPAAVDVVATIKVVAAVVGDAAPVQIWAVSG